MNIQSIIEYLNDSNTQWSSRSNASVELPFEVTPSEYLSFAEKDLELNDVRGHINALSNTKRALDCQIDSILFTFGLYGLAKRKNLNIPRKFNLIKELGIIAPRILSKINSVRNLVEHEYVRPSQEQVEDFYDIIQLFLLSTEKYILYYPDFCQIENDKRNEWLDFNYDREAGYIEFVIHQGGSEEIQTIKVESFDENYIGVYASYIKVALSYD
ncbi:MULTISPECIES: hypothetical protein [Paenibacillus]|uniref:hypothetical protein n=1 Tax=Paenibacillus TaxID=44249 RepID=UPI00096C35AE|nr:MULTISPECIES: hypothetical protein [Paenibacillus]OMF34824.1 hypothetical protein BK134_06100 [Paenibacillus peoriae]OMF46836.1 hypothetical protein BK135_13505 [Paenibacillus peoriae]